MYHRTLVAAQLTGLALIGSGIIPGTQLVMLSVAWMFDRKIAVAGAVLSTWLGWGYVWGFLSGYLLLLSHNPLWAGFSQSWTLPFWFFSAMTAMIPEWHLLLGLVSRGLRRLLQRRLPDLFP